MNKEDCFFLGYVSKLRGKEGELRIRLDVDNPARYKSLESVFVEINDKPVPFFIEKIVIGKGADAVVKLEGIDDEVQAGMLLSCQLYLPVSQLPVLKGKKFYFHEVIGFEVIDKNYGSVGILENIVDVTHHPILQIMNNGKEILIPLVDEFIKKVDRNNKKLEIEAPEGLIEIYI